MKYGCVRTGLKHYDAVLNVKYNEIALDLTQNEENTMWRTAAFYHQYQ